jgi:ACS family glucarate transporter-like MFS transporter
MFLLMLLVATGHFNRISMSVAGAERLIPNHGIEPTQMGWVYTAYLIVYTLCMTPGGLFIDRFGPKRALLVVLGGSAVFTALTGLSGLLFAAPAALWVALLAVRSVMGLCNAPQHPGAAHLVGNWVPPAGRNLANGLVNFAALVGISLTYLVFGWLIDRFNWTGAAFCTSAATLLLAVVWALAASDRPQGAVATKLDVSRPAPGGVALLLRNRSLVLLTVSYALAGYFQYLFFYWAQYYFEQRQVPTETSRVYTSLLALANGVGMVLGGWLTDAVRARFGGRRGWMIVPAACLLLGAAALLPGIYSEATLVTFGCFALSMMVVGGSEGSFWTLSVELGGERGGTAAGILNTGGNAGGLAAPVVTPYLSLLFGWQSGFVVAGVCCVLAALCWVWIDPHERIAEPKHVGESGSGITLAPDAGIRPG